MIYYRQLEKVLSVHRPRGTSPHQMVRRLDARARRIYKNFEGGSSMDSPLAWFILLIAVIFLACIFASAALNELEKHRRENDDFFFDYERRG